METKELGKYPNYSVSQINYYLQCPRKYEYRYVKGISPRTNINLVIGSSIHSGLEHNFSQKIHTMTDLPARKIVDVFAEQMEHSKKEHDIDWGNFKGHVDNGKKLIELYMHDFARPIKPKAVEQEVKFIIPNVTKPLIGYIDLLTTDIGIMEFKTSAQSPSRITIIRNLLQVSGYCYAILKSKDDKEIFSEREAKKISDFKHFNARLDFLVKTKEPKVVPKPVPRTKQDLRRFVHVVQQVTECMEKGVYYPVQNSPLCSEKYCPFWTRCNEELEIDSFLEKKNAK